jgi:hypothetical protein
MCLASLTINSMGQKPKAQLSQKSKKGETHPTFLDDDLDFTDTVLMGFDSIDADLNRPDNVTHPFDFDK